ncbi:sushi, von Willebrand factor type A, EGF and pentraxin domain-containing protein 1-like isoform X2 [Gigantopelta aegis]|uniref:sushi, von Willebrand factor type A, EGF and pentraxin domain-containing protein 1-like isoform X2 n=1 Tax=Gigantopelta aegis TaxID=1735272 RepID=UPI001B88B6D2|nr:sushi, von Willebrand factor type A, EGF and pentraxin domain-containing protein 1-like isoform X2 [Gigantopelta aegis]
MAGVRIHYIILTCFFILQTGPVFSDFGKWRRNGIQVYTSMIPRQIKDGQPCDQRITGSMDGANIPDVTYRTCDVLGRYVTLYTDIDNKGTCNYCSGSVAMDFCEILVMACEPNVKYGSNCNKMCVDRKCADKASSCNMAGTCHGGCQNGWKNPDCTQFQDVNECRTGESTCDTNADCKNTPGSYTCICRDGYTGDGRTCTDLPQKSSDTVITALAATMGIFILLFVISIIVIIRFVMIDRKRSKLTESTAAFSDIKRNENNQTTATEDVGVDNTAGGSQSTISSRSSEQTRQEPIGEHDEQNTPRMPENSQLEANPYYELDVESTDPRSSYEKLNV